MLVEIHRPRPALHDGPSSSACPCVFPRRALSPIYNIEDIFPLGNRLVSDLPCLNRLRVKQFSPIHLQPTYSLLQKRPYTAPFSIIITQPCFMNVSINFSQLFNPPVTCDDMKPLTHYRYYYSLMKPFRLLLQTNVHHQKNIKIYRHTQHNPVPRDRGYVKH